MRAMLVVFPSARDTVLLHSPHHPMPAHSLDFSEDSLLQCRERHCCWFTHLQLNQRFNEELQVLHFHSSVEPGMAWLGWESNPEKTSGGWVKGAPVLARRMWTPTEARIKREKTAFWKCCWQTLSLVWLSGSNCGILHDSWSFGHKPCCGECQQKKLCMGGINSSWSLASRFAPTIKIIQEKELLRKVKYWL